MFGCEHGRRGARPDRRWPRVWPGASLSAVTGRAEIVDAPNSAGGRHYAGNPLRVAAAHAVLDVIAEEKVGCAARR
ncbi:MAG: hypothetical protein R3D53_14140 [Paracoccaceae bacterium]